MSYDTDAALAKRSSKLSPDQRTVLDAAGFTYAGLIAKTSLFEKQTDDPQRRIEDLLDRAEPELRSAFVSIIAQIRNETTLGQLADLIEQGRFQEALESAARAGAQFSAMVNGVYIFAGVDTADFIRERLQVIISFDQLNSRALQLMQSNQLRLIREFSVEQRLATQEALIDGIRRGANPREQARIFRDSIGLTSRQVRSVENFRRLLEENSRDVLTRRLRDRRFDPTIRRAIRDGTPLAQSEINNMVNRYRQRFVDFRARVIARSEALRATHQGIFEMYQQAFDQGLVNPDQVVREWHTAGDERVRDSHNVMNGQTRPVGEAFTSGQGNSLRFPGDPDAPASDTIQCRCVITTRIL